MAMGRPLFLLGSLPMYLMGAAAAWRDGHGVEPAKLVLGMLLVWLIQLMTHYNNEYCDLKTDQATQATTRISGGSRVLVRGLVPRQRARMSAVATLALAMVVLATLAAVSHVGNLLFLFAGAAAFVGWFYSAPPLALESKGLGEIAIVFVTASLLPSTAYYIQASAVSPALVLACAPLALIVLSLTIATGLPDVSADVATGKMTIVARLGEKRALWLHNSVLAMGWLGFNAWTASFRLSPGWFAIAGTAPMVAVVAASLKGAGKGNMKAMERMGMAEGVLLSWIALSVGAQFLLE